MNDTMMPSSTAIPSNDHFGHDAPPPSPFTARLRAAKKSVREATEEALRSARSEETLTGVVVLDGPTKQRIPQDPQQQGDDENAHPNVITDENYDDTYDDEASFELGMSLFGDDVRVVERDLRDRLERVEDELQRVLAEVESDRRRRGLTS
eukprot:8225891-Ditylum_brightwellii.AAC.1